VEGGGSSTNEQVCLLVDDCLLVVEWGCMYVMTMGDLWMDAAASTTTLPACLHAYSGTCLPTLERDSKQQHNVCTGKRRRVIVTLQCLCEMMRLTLRRANTVKPCAADV
jgi:hypothetical protein